MFAIPGWGTRFGANDASSVLPSKKSRRGTTGYASWPPSDAIRLERRALRCRVLRRGWSRPGRHRARRMSSATPQPPQPTRLMLQAPVRAEPLTQTLSDARAAEPAPAALRLVDEPARVLDQLVRATRG